MKKVVIGITDCKKYPLFENWIKACGDEVEIVKLSEKTWNFDDVQQCHAVLFSGGEDINPRFYNKPEWLGHCDPLDMNEKRDEFELKLLEYTESNKIPMLGICRGMQLFNVFKGGTLIPDIPTWGKPTHAKLEDGSDRYHSVSLDANSRLSKIIGEVSGEINSFHHQSVDEPGKGLTSVAVSMGEVIEALERVDPSDGFLCLVQWHPERMYDQKSPFVYKLREAFINEAKANL